MLRKQDNPQAFLKMGKILLLVANKLETTHHCTYCLPDATLQNTSWVLVLFTLARQVLISVSESKDTQTELFKITKLFHAIT